MAGEALRSYPPAIADTYGHNPFNIERSGLHAHELLPGGPSLPTPLVARERLGWPGEESPPSS